MWASTNHIMKAWIEPAQGAHVSADAHAKLCTLLLNKAKEKGAGSVAGDTTLAVDGKAYTGTVLVGGTAPDITFKVRSVAAVKEAPAKATKAAPKKGSGKK